MKLYFPTIIKKQVQRSILHASMLVVREGLYSLDEDFFYEIKWKGTIYGFHLPTGFITNFASVPKCFWRFFNPTDEHLLVASCVHDYILNEFHTYQPQLSRIVIIDGVESDINETIDGFLASDLFFGALKQEKSYNSFIRHFLRLCVKGFYFLTTKGFFKVKY